MRTRQVVDDAHQVVITILPDGSVVTAAPSDTEMERARAAALGYTSSDALWRMTRDHDRLHVLLADAEGKVVSDALWLVAHPTSGSIAQRAAADREERVVLLMQRLLNVGIDAALENLKD